MDLIELNSPEWPDTGTEPGNVADLAYSGGVQPISEYDNWWNYQTSRDLQILEDAINEVRGAFPEGEFVDKHDPVVEGPLDLNGFDLIDGPRTIYSASNEYIVQSVLQNDDIVINAGDDLLGGGRVRLGNSISLNVEDSWVRTEGDTMTGDLFMTESNISVGTTRSHAPLNVRKHNRGGDQYIYTYSPISEYNAVFNNHGTGEEYTSSGIGFSTSSDASDQTPGAAVTYRRTGAWGVGELNLQTKGEPNQTGNCTRQVTIESDGTANFYSNGVKGFVHETRTSDPANAPVGRMWFRTDEDIS